MVSLQQWASPKLCPLLSRSASTLLRTYQRHSQFLPTKRCCLEIEMELGLQHCIVRHDSKPLCSRLDRLLCCFESILSHGPPFHCEAACTLGTSVAPVVLLLFQEKRSIVLVQQASNPHQNTIWIISGLLTIARFFCLYSCRRFPQCSSLVEFFALEGTVGISTFSRCSGAAGFPGALIRLGTSSHESAIAPNCAEKQLDVFIVTIEMY